MAPHVQLRPDLTKSIDLYVYAKWEDEFRGITLLCNIMNVDCDGFKQLGIADWLCRHIASVGFKYPTNVQKSCIPPILEGNNTNADGKWCDKDYN